MREMRGHGWSAFTAILAVKQASKVRSHSSRYWAGSFRFEAAGYLGGTPTLVAKVGCRFNVLC